MQLLPSHSLHCSQPRKAHRGVLDTESSIIRGLFIQSSLKSHWDHITAGGLGVLATKLCSEPLPSVLPGEGKGALPPGIYGSTLLCPMLLLPPSSCWCAMYKDRCRGLLMVVMKED